MDPANALAPALFTTLLAWQPQLPWLAQAALLLVALAGVRRVEPRLATAAVRTWPARASEHLAQPSPTPR